MKEAKHYQLLPYRSVEAVRVLKGLERAGRCAVNRGASARQQCLLRGPSHSLGRRHLHHAPLGLRRPQGLCDEMDGGPAGCQRGVLMQMASGEVVMLAWHGANVLLLCDSGPTPRFSFEDQ